MIYVLHVRIVFFKFLLGENYFPSIFLDLFSLLVFDSSLYLSSAHTIVKKIAFESESFLKFGNSENWIVPKIGKLLKLKVPEIGQLLKFESGIFQDIRRLQKLGHSRNRKFLVPYTPFAIYYHRLQLNI